MPAISSGRELSTLFLAPPTGAAFIRVDYGRVFIAANNYVLFSEPLNYELFNVAYNTIRSTLLLLASMYWRWLVHRYRKGCTSYGALTRCSSR